MTILLSIVFFIFYVLALALCLVLIAGVVGAIFMGTDQILKGWNDPTDGRKARQARQESLKEWERRSRYD